MWLLLIKTRTKTKAKTKTNTKTKKAVQKSRVQCRKLVCMIMEGGGEKRRRVQKASN